MKRIVSLIATVSAMLVTVSAFAQPGIIGGLTASSASVKNMEDVKALNTYHAGLTCKVIATPGHTPGSCCYYFEEEKVLVSGDTLFCGSVGRTDFPGGSASLLLESGKKLLTLPEDVRVLPGHDQSTTIGYEKKYNYYLGEGDHSWFG